MGWRKHFPVTQNLIYLDHAGVGPMPQRTVDAMTESLQAQAMRGSLEHPSLHEQAERARECYARLIGARPDQVAHVSSTSAGISLIARGLTWRPGDEVVVCDIDFPSAVLPWMMLQSQGVIVRRVACAEGRVEIDHLLAGCSMRTRVVCVSWVQFSSGFRIDLQTLGAACRQRDILLIVDGMQGVGALPIDVSATPVDGLVTQSYKWLLGPQGNGWLYLDDALSRRLSVSAAGVRSVTPKPSYLDHRFDLRDDVARFETGILDFHGIVGVRTSLELLAQVGQQHITSAITGLMTRLHDGLIEAGMHVKGGSDRRDFQTGILAFRHPRYDADACCAHLLQAGIVTSSREQHVRVSPHFYNTEVEIDALLDRIARLSG